MEFALILRRDVSRGGTRVDVRTELSWKELEKAEILLVAYVGGHRCDVITPLNLSRVGTEKQEGRRRR